MAEPEVVHYYHYLPQPVQKVLASGSYAFIGLVDESTVLKYPLDPNDDMERLKTESRLLALVGKHPGIIAHKGLTSDGLYLERAKGSLYWYLLATTNHVSIQQRLTWAIQLANAVGHVHASNVMHCDIQPHNVLLSESLQVKLSDFQGVLLSEKGDIVESGWSGEPCRYACPREDEFSASVQTDLFALGSTLHFFFTGQEVFSDIVDGEDGWQEKVKTRFENGVYPDDSGICTTVTQKCWRCEYGSAAEIVHDLEAIQNSLMV